LPRLYALILSGGAGTRLWPLSRRAKPKQFLPLVGERTLLQDTVDRVAEIIPLERIFAVAPPEHRELIHEQLPELRVDHVVVEPYPRGNAAAIGLAMAALHAFDPDAVVAILPSDHVIERRGKFREVLIAATAAAEAGSLVTLGIEPESPDTGFGYIESGDKLDLKAPLPVHAVKRFIEKPKRDAAEKMIAAGGHYWNAGMFVWRVAEIVKAFEEHLPGTAKALRHVAEALAERAEVQPVDRPVPVNIEVVQVRRRRGEAGDLRHALEERAEEEEPDEGLDDGDGHEPRLPDEGASVALGHVQGLGDGGHAKDSSVRRKARPVWRR